MKGLVVRMDVLSSSFRDTFIDLGEDYLYALAGALVSSDYIKGFNVFVVNDSHDGVSSVRILAHFDNCPEKYKVRVFADLRFNVAFDKNPQFGDSDFIYVKLFDMYDNKMFVSYDMNNATSFVDFACWIRKAMERFAGTVDFDRVCM